MNKEYWVIKVTDRDSDGYIFEDAVYGGWCYTSISSNTAKFKDLKSCQAELDRFKDNCDYDWYCRGHIRPVKVKVKMAKKQKDLPTIASIWEAEDSFYFVVDTFTIDNQVVVEYLYTCIGSGVATRFKNSLEAWNEEIVSSKAKLVELQN